MDFPIMCSERIYMSKPKRVWQNEPNSRGGLASRPSTTFGERVILPAPIDGYLPPGTGFSGPGYQNHLPGGHKQNKASVLGRTLKVPTIVLTAGLAT